MKIGNVVVGGSGGTIYLRMTQGVKRTFKSNF